MTVLVREDGTFTPIDHKTASSDPREKDIFEAYQHQLNFYALLLEKNQKANLRLWPFNLLFSRTRRQIR